MASATASRWPRFPAGYVCADARRPGRGGADRAAQGAVVLISGVSSRSKEAACFGGLSRFFTLRTSVLSLPRHRLATRRPPCRRRSPWPLATWFAAAQAGLHSACSTFRRVRGPVLRSDAGASSMPSARCSGLHRRQVRPPDRAGARRGEGRRHRRHLPTAGGDERSARADGVVPAVGGRLAVVPGCRGDGAMTREKPGARCSVPGRVLQRPRGRLRAT